MLQIACNIALAGRFLCLFISVSPGKQKTQLYSFPSHKIIMLNLNALLETLICMNGLLGGVNPGPADYVSVLTIYFPTT